MKNCLIPFFGTALLLMACGDEVTNISEYGGADTVKAFKDLGKCDKSAIGKFVYVSDSVKVYACTDDGWAAVTGTAVSGKNGSNGTNGEKGDKGDKGDDGDSCEGVQNKDGSVTIKCGGKKIGTISNGDDGAQGPAGESCEGVQNDDGSVTISCGGKEVGTITNGNDGAQGPAGESCKGVKNKDGSVTIKCGGKDVGTITNGNDGAPGTSCEGALNKNGSVTIKCGGKEIGTISNGNDGENGASCKIASDKDGVVQLQCGEGESAVFTELYKAMCGTKPYDPKKSFCTAKGEVYELCKGKTYDTQSEFCYEDEKYDFCEGDRYNPTEEFCVDNKLHTRCNGEEYDLTSEFCINNKKYDFCEGGSYNPSEKFCNNNKLYDLCGDTDYNPLTHLCKNGAVVEASLCGDIVYDPDEEFCAMFNGGNVQQVYKKTTITIKSENYSRTWMAENLNYEVENSSCYRDISSNCDTYGRLYTWAAAVGRTEDKCGSGKSCISEGVVQGICPEGWHLPSKAEWGELFDAVGGASAAFTVLRSNEGWKNSNGTDKYGFTMLPGGEYIVESEGVPFSGYYYISNDASFWTSDADGKTHAYGILLNVDVGLSINKSYSKDDQFSVRCVKDLVTE